MTEPAAIEQNTASTIELGAFEAVANAMESAEHAIDLQFGSGYAEKHPVMIAGYLQAVAVTYLAERLGAKLHQVLCELEEVKLTIAEVGHG